MPRESRYFHREFLAKPNEENTSASVMARVGKSESDYPYLGASLIFSDGYDSVHLGFHSGEPKDVDAALARAKKLHDVVMKFYEALEAEAKEVKSQLAASTKK